MEWSHFHDLGEERLTEVRFKREKLLREECSAHKT
jgi:hypothetical protein